LHEGLNSDERNLIEERNFDSLIKDKNNYASDEENCKNNHPYYDDGEYNNVVMIEYKESNQDYDNA
jgi:hypothetical protein